MSKRPVKRLVSFAVAFAILIFFVSYFGYVSVTVHVVDANGSPVENARVAGVLYVGSADVEKVYYGSTDNPGNVVFQHSHMPVPYGTMSLRAVGADESYGGITVNKVTRSATIQLKAMPKGLEKYVNYDQPGGGHEVIDRTLPRVWDLSAGESRSLAPKR